jgi:hypothetical protein
MSTQPQATQSREHFFQGLLEHLTVPFLKPIAEGFFENIRQVESLIQMPLMMFAMLEIDGQISDQFQTLALNYWSRGERFANFLDAAKRISVEPAKQPDFIERTLKYQDKVLAIPQCGEILKTSMEVLYRAGVSESWTALECLAADLWVTSLNEEPTTLAQTAISSLDAQEPTEFSSKHIPVGLPARFGFDLRHCLGTVLKSKFDFTGVSGIQKAYKVFVPNDEFIQRVLSQPELGELEATRHVIVHRAGRVDEEYRRRTGSQLPVGAVLAFTREQAVKFSYVSAHAGTGLLAFVNDWLMKNKAARKQGLQPSVSST